MPERRSTTSFLRALLAAPAALLPLLPSATCPLCVAGYASALSALGLGFLVTEDTLRPLILVFLGGCVLSVAWGSYRRRRWAPVGLALAGAAGVIAGRLVWNLPPVLYGGVALLVLASVLTLVMKRRDPHNSTPVEQEASHEGEASSCCCGRGSGLGAGEYLPARRAPDGQPPTHPN